MTFFFVLVIIFAILFLSPFLASVLFNTKDTVKPLKVSTDNVKNPRYFAISFRTMFEEALGRSAPDSSTLMLSREEPFVRGDGSPFLDQHYTQLVYEGVGDFRSERSTFDKEIYAAHDAVVGEGSDIRAIASLGHLLLADGTSVTRWADAEKGCRVGCNCDLGISLSSKGPITIDLGTYFRRVFAPMIYIGNTLPDSEIMDSHDREAGAKVKDVLFDIDLVSTGETLDNTIITRYDLLVREGATVHGSIKSNGNIHIGSESLVTGGVFADGSIVIEQGARIQGDVFAQDVIVVGADSVIGVRGLIRSMIARERIYLCEGATVYGYLGSEDASTAIKSDTFLTYANDHF